MPKPSGQPIELLYSSCIARIWMYVLYCSYIKGVTAYRVWRFCWRLSVGNRSIQETKKKNIGVTGPSLLIPSPNRWWRKRRLLRHAYPSQVVLLTRSLLTYSVLVLSIIHSSLTDLVTVSHSPRSRGRECHKLPTFARR